MIGLAEPKLGPDAYYAFTTAQRSLEVGLVAAVLYAAVPPHWSAFAGSPKASASNTFASEILDDVSKTDAPLLDDDSAELALARSVSSISVNGPDGDGEFDPDLEAQTPTDRPSLGFRRSSQLHSDALAVRLRRWGLSFRHLSVDSRRVRGGSAPATDPRRGRVPRRIRIPPAPPP